MTTELTEDVRALLRRKLAEMIALRYEYRKELQHHSSGRLHHQGCPIGGLMVVGEADVSGAPCWCGERR